MPTLTWRLEGKWIKSCNCAPGCPCDFWAPPTHGRCDGMFAMKVEKGYFGETKMDGVKFGVVLTFPGPLHEGNGTVVPFVDAKASQAQREAALRIMSGKTGNPWFALFPALVTKVHEPRFTPVRFEFDVKKKKARVSVEGLLETVTEHNLATGEIHEIRVHLPGGLEYKHAETATSTGKATGPIEYSWTHGHTSMAQVVQSERGLLR